MRPAKCHLISGPREDNDPPWLSDYTPTAMITRGHKCICISYTTTVIPTEPKAGVCTLTPTTVYFTYTSRRCMIRSQKLNLTTLGGLAMVDFQGRNHWVTVRVIHLLKCISTALFPVSKLTWNHLLRSEPFHTHVARNCWQMHFRLIVVDKIQTGWYPQQIVKWVHLSAVEYWSVAFKQLSLWIIILAISVHTKCLVLHQLYLWLLEHRTWYFTYKSPYNIMYSPLVFGWICVHSSLSVAQPVIQYGETPARW